MNADRNRNTPPRGIPEIEDARVTAECAANEDAGSLDLTFRFCDERDPSLKARVVLQIHPREAVDLIARMIGELGKLGVKISPEPQS